MSRPKTKTIQSLIDEALKKRGKYGAARVERAADEIKNLEKLYTEQALRDALLSRQSALSTMKPGDFAKFAYGLEPTEGRKRYVDYLARIQGGFEDVPLLEIRKSSGKNKISEHEGRHRSLALESKGEPASLVRVYPEKSLFAQKSGMTQEEMIEAMRRELGEDRLVIPQDDTFPEQFPDIYKDGGPVHLNGGGNPIDEAIKQAKMAGPAGRPIRQAAPVDIDQMRRELEQAVAETAALKAQAMPPAEMKPYEPTLQQRLGEAVDKGLRAIGSPANRSRQLSGVITGGATGSPLPLGANLTYLNAPLAFALNTDAAGRSALENIRDENYLAAGIDVLGAGLDVGPFAKPAYQSAKKAVMPTLRHAGKMIDEAMLTGQGPLAGGLSAILPRRMDVYHGSPHRFEKFDASKIGTGEGAQAYGHGLYFAQIPEVAKQYRADRSYVGRAMSGKSDNAEWGADRIAKNAIDIHGDDAASFLQRVLKQNSRLKAPGQASENQKVADAIALIQNGAVSRSGNLYRVDLPDEMIPKMLDWDKPLSEQPEAVQNIFSEIPQSNVVTVKGGERYASTAAEKQAHSLIAETGSVDGAISRGRELLSELDPKTRKYSNVRQSLLELESLKKEGAQYGPVNKKYITGLEIYDELQSKFGPQAASDFLQKRGVPGIKYLDQSSRQAAEGTRNFVVFPGEEQALTIKERMKKGGPVSMDAMRMAVMDKAQRKAIGGELIKGATKGIGKVSKAVGKVPEKEYKTPAKFERAPAKTKAEIEALAQRMAPQFLGEFVRKPESTFSVAGKSFKQYKQEKDLPVTYKGEREKPSPVDIAEHEGSVIVGVPGDPTIAHLALEQIGDIKPETPVELHGGPLYGLKGQFWASGSGPASGLQSTALRASEAYGGAPTLGEYIRMPEGTPYALHTTDALLAFQRPDLLSKSKIEKLNSQIRKGNLKYSFPEFVGFEDPELVLLQAQDNPNLRKHINNVLLMPTTSEKYGLFPGKNIEAAITEEELRNLETGATGFSIGRLFPRSRLTESEHPTYEFDIPGQLLGQSKYPQPYELAFPDTLKFVRENLKPGVGEFGMLKMSGPRQIIDPQYIDEIKMYEEGMKKLTGKKKGGKVERKAEGGITSDDLIIEERAL